MDKVSTQGFSADNCDGCPHRVKSGDTDGGNVVVDAVADVETRATEAVTGEEQAKCGLCGCPLMNLELVQQAPEDCPRLDRHGGVLD